MGRIRSTVVVVVVKDIYGWGWMTACCEEHGDVAPGGREGAEALDNAWRRADFRQSNVRRQREAS